MSEVTKCGLCGREAVVNAEGRCRACHARAGKADDPKVAGGYAVEKGFTCPECRRPVAQLYKIREINATVCKACVQKYIGKVPTIPTEPETPVRAHMVVSQVTLARGRQVPTVRVGQRADGDRMILKVDEVKRDAKIRAGLEALDAGPVEEISLADLATRADLADGPRLVDVIPSVTDEDPEPVGVSAPTQPPRPATRRIGGKAKR